MILLIFQSMTAPGKPLPKINLARGKQTYRNVTLQRPATRSQYSSAEIKKAVDDALAKNPGAVVHRK